MGRTVVSQTQDGSAMIAQLERKPEWISYEDFLATVDEGTRAEWVAYEQWGLI